MFAPHALSVATQIALERVDKARALWFDHVGGLDPEIAQAKRAKTLRRHAIETGIIEGLYDITYGETEALVDRGLQIQFFERQDQGSKSALETIENQ